MEKQRIQWPFPDRGLNLELDQRHIPPDQLQACTNLYYARPDLLRSRGGIDATYTGSTGDDIQVMYWWDEDSKLYHGDDDAHLYKNSTAVTGPTTNVVDMVAFGDLLIVVEVLTASHTLHTYSGSSYAALSGTDVPQNVKRVLVKHGRLFALGDDYIYWSDAGDATVWTGGFQQGGRLAVAKGQDGHCQDWIDYDGRIYIWKERGVYVLNGDHPSNFTVQKIESCPPVVARGLADVNAGIVFTTTEGIWPVGRKYMGEPHDLTRDVQGTLTPSLASANCAYSPELGCLVLVVGTTTGWLCNVNNRPDVWTQISLPVAMDSVYEGNGLWFGGTDGKVYGYSHTGYEDDSTPFTVSLKTGSFDVGDPLHKKELLYFEGHVNATATATATVGLFADEAGSATVSQAFATTARNIFPCSFNCERVAVQVAYTVLTAPCAFAGFALQGNRKGEIV